MTVLAARRLRGGVQAAASCALALALGGCFGSSSSSSSAGASDPASAVPASALAYVEAVVRPTGSLLSGFNAAAERLADIADPGPKIDALLDKALPHGTSYADSIRPWLGQQAAVAVLAGTTTRHGELAVVLEQTNTARAEAALKSLDKALSGTSDTFAPESYRGISYTDDTTSDTDAGIIGKFVVITSGTAAFDAMVDVDKGAASLASVAGYKQALSAELPGADGVAYVPLLKLVDALVPTSSASSAAGSEILQELRSKYAKAILSGSARLNADGAAVDLAVSGAPLSSSPAETNPIGALPAGSWVALGATNVGPTLAKLLNALVQLGSSGSAAGLGSFTRSLSEIQQVTGLNVEGDLNSITTTAFFIKGANLGSLEAALVLGVKDPSQAPAIVAQFKRLGALIAASDHAFTIGSLSQSNIQSGFTINVPNVPFTFDVAAGGGRIVVALGSSSLNDALSDSDRLSGSAAYTGAASLLGGDVQPDVIVELPQLVSLLKSLGVASSASDANAIGYIQRLGTLAIGSGESAGSEHVRLVISGS
jgi:hypothetical protein